MIMSNYIDLYVLNEVVFVEVSWSSSWNHSLEGQFCVTDVSTAFALVMIRVWPFYSILLVVVHNVLCSGSILSSGWHWQWNQFVLSIALSLDSVIQWINFYPVDNFYLIKNLTGQWLSFEMLRFIYLFMNFEIILSSPSIFEYFQLWSIFL